MTAGTLGGREMKCVVIKRLEYTVGIGKRSRGGKVFLSAILCGIDTQVGLPANARKLEVQDKGGYILG